MENTRIIKVVAGDGKTTMEMVASAGVGGRGVIPRLDCYEIWN